MGRLLEAGIDRDHVNRLGWTALLEAVVLGDGGRTTSRTVRALVRGGVDVDVADGDGSAPSPMPGARVRSDRPHPGAAGASAVAIGARAPRACHAPGS